MKAIRIRVPDIDESPLSEAEQAIAHRLGIDARSGHHGVLVYFAPPEQPKWHFQMYASHSAPARAAGSGAA